MIKICTKFIKKWGRRDDGTAAIEFSLMAIPFTMAVIGVIEMAMVFTASALLESAKEVSTRMIRTGQIQQSNGDPEEEFRTALCDNADMFLICDRLQYEVIAIPDDSFEGASNLPPATFDLNGNLESATFSPGGAGEVVLVRIFYNYPIITPMMQPILANGPDNTRRLMATTVFRTEPYEFEEDS